jgi:Spy/CpxP family protein refolding chaperone
LVNIWKPIFAALVIFAAGVVTGGLTTRLALPQKTPPPSPGAPPGGFRGIRTELVARMQRELYLTTEQREKIEKTLRESHERTRKLWDGIAPQAQAEQKRVREEIRAILNTEQQAKFDESFKMRGAGRFGGERMRDEGRKFEDRKSGRTNRESSVNGSENWRERQTQ